jgi:hypothetical protein
VFKLTERLVHHLKIMGKYQPKCFNCGKEFKVGDYVLSKVAISGCRNSTRKWYCLDCAKKLNIWVKR